MRSRDTDKELLSAIEALLLQLAPRVGGTLAKDRASRWFDGFADFVVENREALQRRSTCQLDGTQEGLPWLLLGWLDVATDGPVHLDLFVEVRRPPGYIALPSSSTKLRRPHDRELATTLDRAGFHVEIGRWGLQVTTRDPARLLRDGITGLELAFTTAIRLARSVAIAERHLPHGDSSPD